jgi:hypothetical protein
MPSLKNNDITSKEKLQEKKLIGTKPKLKAGSGGNGNNPPLPNNPTEDYCFPGPYKTTSNKDAYVVVGGRDCSDWACDENYEVHHPQITVDIVPPDYAGFDYCNNLAPGEVGVTHPLFDWDCICPNKKGQLVVPF